MQKSKLGVDVENNFEPYYIIPVQARKTVNYLKKEAAKAQKIILATDEDREGEAIAWHLMQAIDPSNSKSIQRMVVHEITKSDIENALKNPRQIHYPLVTATPSRLILERLVGSLTSPLLWKKIIRGL